MATAATITTAATVADTLRAIEARAERAIVQELRLMTHEILGMRTHLALEDRAHADSLLMKLDHQEPCFLRYLPRQIEGEEERDAHAGVEMDVNPDGASSWGVREIVYRISREARECGETIPHTTCSGRAQGETVEKTLNLIERLARSC